MLKSRLLPLLIPCFLLCATCLRGEDSREGLDYFEHVRLTGRWCIVFRRPRVSEKGGGDSLGNGACASIYLRRTQSSR